MGVKLLLLEANLQWSYEELQHLVLTGWLTKGWSLLHVTAQLQNWRKFVFISRCQSEKLRRFRLT